MSVHAVADEMSRAAAFEQARFHPTTVPLGCYDVIRFVDAASIFALAVDNEIVVRALDLNAQFVARAIFPDTVFGHRMMVAYVEALAETFRG